GREGWVLLPVATVAVRESVLGVRDATHFVHAVAAGQLHGNADGERVRLDWRHDVVCRHVEPSEQWRTAGDARPLTPRLVSSGEPAQLAERVADDLQLVKQIRHPATPAEPPCLPSGSMIQP